MAINQSYCLSFIKETLQAVHNFGPSPDTFMCALYTDTATLNQNTTVYVTDGEASGTNYTAGGLPLTVSQEPIISGSAVYISFSDLTWPTGTLITARGALVYNASQGNKAVFVIDFGLTIDSTTSGLFRISFPPLGPSTAILSIS